MTPNEMIISDTLRAVIRLVSQNSPRDLGLNSGKCAR